jgi:uncharacterized coiled-coil protein SlyX
MTRTSFENKVTLGNLLTALPMLAAAVWGWATLQGRQDAFETRFVRIETAVEASENRLRVLEQAAATSTARYESLAQALGEVKAEIRQTNDLLRRLLEGRGDP